MNPELFNAVVDAAKVITDNGRLRSQLRQAKSGRDAIGLAEASKFDAVVRGACPWLRRHDYIAEECLILIAQRNTKRLQRDEKSSPCVHLAALLGGGSEADRPLSSLRFQRLLRAKAGEDRLRQMRRALALLKEPAQPKSVVEAYLDLHTDSGARHFANLYFNGAPTAALQPAIESSTDQGTSP